jgi:hypothetical protein
MSIDDHRVQGPSSPLIQDFPDTELQISSTPINQGNSPSGNSGMFTPPKMTILHIPPEIIDQILTLLPLYVLLSAVLKDFCL